MTKRGAQELDDVLSCMQTSMYKPDLMIEDGDEKIIVVNEADKNNTLYPQIEAKRLRIISALATQFQLDCNTVFVGNRGCLPHFEAWLTRSKFLECNHSISSNDNDINDDTITTSTTTSTTTTATTTTTTTTSSNNNDSSSYKIDPIIPLTAYKDSTLFDKLTKTFSKTASRKIIGRLQTICVNGISELQILTDKMRDKDKVGRANGPRIFIERIEIPLKKSGNTEMLIKKRFTFHKAVWEITENHYNKLLGLYRFQRRNNSNSNSNSSGSSINDNLSINSLVYTTATALSSSPSEDDYIFCVAIRYACAVGGNSRGGLEHGALPDDLQLHLRLKWNVRMECFASPFNVYLPTRNNSNISNNNFQYCSAFYDTDSMFGSIGSFFKFYPEEGVYQANPPFEDVIVTRMCQHMLQLITNSLSSNDNSDNSDDDDINELTFIVTIKADLLETLQEVVGIKDYIRYTLNLPASTHAYKRGNQYALDTYTTIQYNNSAFDSVIVWISSKNNCKSIPSNDNDPRLIEITKLFNNPENNSEKKRHKDKKVAKSKKNLKK